MAMTRLLEIQYTRSAIGRNERQRRTVQALGLHKLQDTVRHSDNATIRGMVHSIKHLVTCREIEEGQTQ
ncbi:MAG: 50S ribosomal protein L30 [Chloroflexota bacterium]